MGGLTSRVRRLSDAACRPPGTSQEHGDLEPRARRRMGQSIHSSGEESNVQGRHNDGWQCDWKSTDILQFAEERQYVVLARGH